MAETDTRDLKRGHAPRLGRDWRAWHYSLWLCAGLGAGCFSGGDGGDGGTQQGGGASDAGGLGPDASSGATTSGTGGAQGGTGGAQGGSGGGAGGSGGGSDPLPCPGGGPCFDIAVTNIDKADILFVVDNSGSMREEQTALQREFPGLIHALTTGERTSGAAFPAARDLHLGVVSSDMGLVNIQGIPHCDGLGDDGVMNNIPSTAVDGCQASYPRFLTHLAGIHDPETTATDFACIATLGTDGCGFEQPLEAALKALWPSIDLDQDGNVIEPNRIFFLGDAMGFGQLGHGDTDNRDFLRSDPKQGLSAIAVVVVTDEEDCSSADTSHFTPELYLDPNDPDEQALAMQDLNLRCFYNEQNLYNVERYVAGLQALRPGNEHLVTFAAIAGVPPDLVDEFSRASTDLSDPTAREAYYAAILADPRMQETPDPSKLPGEGNLTPSCVTTNGIAYPPRRITEVAKSFGESGVLQSICQEDFGPAMDMIVDTVAKQLGSPCLPRALARSADGLVGCKVYWALPVPGQAPATTPTACTQQPFLSEPAGGPITTEAGGMMCEVDQLAVMDGALQPGGATEGWYYDDFSDEAVNDCLPGTPQRVAFTATARPPTGVRIVLDCSRP